jgi:hypothetical protein
MRTRNSAVTSNRRMQCACRLLVTAAFLVNRFLSPWWWRRQVTPKRRFLQEPHCVTSQKTPFFITIPCLRHEVQNCLVHKGGDRYLQMFSYLDIFILYPFLGANYELLQRYPLPNYTWNAFQLPHVLNTTSQLLAITVHLIRNYCTLWPPLWPSGQTSWLQTQRSRVPFNGGTTFSE